MSFKSIFTVVATAVIAFSSIVVSTGSAEADSGVDVYTTQGFHTSGGREWKTNCSQYTVDLTRCTTEIKTGGKWVFNNLTYRTASKDVWGSNQLSRPGKFTSGGREWMTSCNDDWTGYNGCRSFIKSGGKWVFNNIVQFTPGTAHFPKFSLIPETGSFSAVSTPATHTRVGDSGAAVYTTSKGWNVRSVLNRGAVVLFTGHSENGRSEILHSGNFYWVNVNDLIFEGINKPNFAGGPVANPSWISNDKSLNKGYSGGLHKVNANAHKVVTYVWANYPTIKTMYGWVNKSTPDHPAGRAVDVMIPNYKTNKTFGWAMAHFFRENAQQFGIDYIMYDQKIWSVQRDHEGWRTFADRGGDSANHIDHLHINTFVPGTERYKRIPVWDLTSMTSES